MARLVLCVLALLAAGGLAEPAKKVLPQKVADVAFLQKQRHLMSLFYHVRDPTFLPEQKTVASTWSIEQNIEKFANVTAVKIYIDLFENYLLPRWVPFSILNSVHRFEAVTLFNVLYSAKDFDTFYKTAAYLRDHVNDGLWYYVTSAAILHRPDTQGMHIDYINNVSPSFFFNGEIMETAERINVHGKNLVEHYPSTFIWNDNVVIRWNATRWPYFSKDVTYFTHDISWNTWYFNTHLAYPFWLGGETTPLVKDKRGEWFWFMHKQLIARYYMERLSNGLGEIPVLGLDVVQQGYTSGLVYDSGVPFPSRPNHFHLDQPDFVQVIEKISDYERRVRDAIEQGYFVNSIGEHVNINTPEAIDVLGRLIEANVDSPNTKYYKDFISLWKSLLGNTVVEKSDMVYKKDVPLVVPSVLEHYQSALRDPAFYMIWKRVLGLFTLWHKQLPPYKPEQLALPSVEIQKVEVDKLVTYFEHAYSNVTNHLTMNEHERKTILEDVCVLVQRAQLNHKAFQVRVNVKSDVAKTVVVRFFLAPKYDSHGYEIPLEVNTENFLLLDQFTYNLPQGETVIRRDSTENTAYVDDKVTTYDIYQKTLDVLEGKGQFILDQSRRFDGFIQRLVLPKGRIGGMPFVFMVYISEYRAPKVPFGTGFDPVVSLGLGSGALRFTDDPLGFPLDRPLQNWQIKDLRNLFIQDVNIYHKYTPEIDVPHVEL